jgi:hypothetical protein
MLHQLSLGICVSVQELKCLGCAGYGWVKRVWSLATKHPLVTPTGEVDMHANAQIYPAQVVTEIYSSSSSS